jgi:outer membrane protein assembly factor BamB
MSDTPAAPDWVQAIDGLWYAVDDDATLGDAGLDQPLGDPEPHPESDGVSEPGDDGHWVQATDGKFYQVPEHASGLTDAPTVDTGDTGDPESEPEESEEPGVLEEPGQREDAAEEPTVSEPSERHAVVSDDERVYAFDSARPGRGKQLLTGVGLILGAVALAAAGLLAFRAVNTDDGAVAGTEEFSANFADVGPEILAVGDSQVVVAEPLSSDYVALDRSTGETAWTREFLVDGSAPAAVVQGGVVLLGGSAGSTAPVVAVDLATGDELWRSSEASLSESFAYGDDRYLLVETEPPSVSMIATDSGEQIWATGPEAGSVLAAFADLLVLAGPEGTDDEPVAVRGLDPSDGSVRWTASTTVGLARTPVDVRTSEDATGVVVMNDGLTVLDADSGAPAWSSEAESVALAPDNDLVVGCQRNGDTLTATGYSRSSGDVRFAADLTDVGGSWRVLGANASVVVVGVVDPEVVDGADCLGAPDGDVEVGEMQGLSTGDGAQVWEREGGRIDQRVVSYRMTYPNGTATTGETVSLELAREERFNIDRRSLQYRFYDLTTGEPRTRPIEAGPADAPSFAEAVAASVVLVDREGLVMPYSEAWEIDLARPVVDVSSRDGLVFVQTDDLVLHVVR